MARVVAEQALGQARPLAIATGVRSNWPLASPCPPWSLQSPTAKTPSVLLVVAVDQHRAHLAQPHPELLEPDALVLGTGERPVA